MCLCFACLCGTTLAWLSDTKDISAQRIEAAYYDISAEIDGKPINGGSHELSAGVHEIKLTAIGSASSGYCILDLDGDKLHTEQFPTEDEPLKNEISFDLDIKAPVKIKILPHLGKTKNATVEDGGRYPYSGSESASQPTFDGNEESDSQLPSGSDEETAVSISEHTIVKGETLTSIAKAYGTSVKELAAYNGIADADNIYAGDTLLIPSEGKKE